MSNDRLSQPNLIVSLIKTSLFTCSFFPTLVIDLSTIFDLLTLGRISTLNHWIKAGFKTWKTSYEPSRSAHRDPQEGPLKIWAKFHKNFTFPRFFVAWLTRRFHSFALGSFINNVTQRLNFAPLPPLCKFSSQKFNPLKKDVTNQFHPHPALLNK